MWDVGNDEIKEWIMRSLCCKNQLWGLWLEIPCNSWLIPRMVSSTQGCFISSDIHTILRNLKYFMTTRVLNRCQTRWSMSFSRFDFTITYRPETNKGCLMHYLEGHILCQKKKKLHETNNKQSFWNQNCSTYEQQLWWF